MHKENNPLKMSHRKDGEGHCIQTGGHYKVMFVDEVSESRRHSVATTYEVPSYKRYNQNTC